MYFISMRKLTRKEINNELDSFPVTYQDIETQIIHYSLDFPQTRNERVEWEIEFPMFVPSFYKYIISRNGLVPSQEQYWETYQNDYRQWFRKENLKDELLMGLKARIYRTYPSLVRDIHFAKYLKNTLMDADVLYDVMLFHYTKYLENTLTYIEVIYNMQLDIKEGIDLLLVVNRRCHAVNLYTDTGLSHMARQKKLFRHANYSNVNYIEIPVAFNGSRQVGDFFLYGEREQQKIIELL